MSLQSILEILQKGLIEAAKAGDIKLMQEFIEAGVNPLVPDERNCCAIHYAIESDTSDLTALLI